MMFPRRDCVSGKKVKTATAVAIFTISKSPSTGMLNSLRPTTLITTMQAVASANRPPSMATKPIRRSKRVGKGAAA
jgi:hypothetical protein